MRLSKKSPRSLPSETRIVSGPASQEAGQSTVEFAMVLPLVLSLLLVVAQVGLIVQAQISVVHGAREAARALSVDPTVDAYRVVGDATMLERDRTEIVVDTRLSAVPERRLVSVTVRYEVPSIGPFAWLGAHRVSASLSMLTESNLSH